MHSPFAPHGANTGACHGPGQQTPVPLNPRPVTRPLWGVVWLVLGALAYAVGLFGLMRGVRLSPPFSDDLPDTLGAPLLLIAAGIMLYQGLRRTVGAISWHASKLVGNLVPALLNAVIAYALLAAGQPMAYDEFDVGANYFVWRCLWGFGFGLWAVIQLLFALLALWSARANRIFFTCVMVAGAAYTMWKILF